MTIGASIFYPVAECFLLCFSKYLSVWQVVSTSRKKIEQEGSSSLKVIITTD